MKRFFIVDILKLICAFLVVSIHYGDYWIDIFGRIVIPFFFICAGFFYSDKDNENSQKKAVKFIRSALKYYFFATVFYMFWGLIKHNFNYHYFENYFYYFNPVNWAKILFYSEAIYYHIWFLSAYLGISLINIIITKLKLQKFYYIAPLLLIIFLLGQSYSYVFNINFSFGTRNTIWFALPFFAIGYLLKINLEKITVKNKVLLYCFLAIGIIFTFGQMLEHYLIQTNFGDLVRHSGYISSIIASISLFIFAISIDIENKHTKRYYKIIPHDAMLYIYIVHGFVGEGIFHLNTITSYNIGIPILVFVVSFIMAIGYIFIYNIIKKAIIKLQRKSEIT